ncbi:MAG: hypothetical protein KF870_11460, partial [Leadbetterella sp.]|nr:hypothetical protein [Leadbetterella sp.]
QIGAFLIPFVDGDAAGNGYVTNLKNTLPKPPFVLQLKNNHYLEHLLAWILLPSNFQDERNLKTILDNKPINYYDINQLGDLLANDYKSYWKVHDDLIELMVASSEMTLKVKKIINAFDKIVLTCDSNSLNPDWVINTVESNSDTTVLTLNIY